MERKTYFVDIDGTLVYQPTDFNETVNTETLIPLPNTANKLMEWHCNGSLIILTTARPESMRDLTNKQLTNLGFIYDRLIMGIGCGPRILVNDTLDTSFPKAIAYNVARNNEGLSNID
jgi:hypothetical protein